MLLDQNIEQFLRVSQSVIDSSFDPICLVNRSNKIIYFNSTMRSMLDQSAKDLREGPCFCKLMALDVCKSECQIESAIRTGHVVTHEATSAKVGDKIYQIMFRVVPIFHPTESQRSDSIGALIQVRDITQHIELLQKYKVLLRSITDVVSRGEEIKQLKGKLNQSTG